MTDRYRDILTGSGVWIALFASLGGCVLRYLEEYKHEKKWHWKWLAADLLSSAFLGYFTFWVLWDSAHFTASQCAVATAIVGNFGTRIFDVVRFVIFKKIGTSRRMNAPLPPMRNPRNEKLLLIRHSACL